MLVALLLTSIVHAAPSSLAQIWARAELTRQCPRGEDLDRLPPEAAMAKLEAILYLTEEELALLVATTREKFDEVVFNEFAVNGSDCAQARLQLGKAVRRGPKRLAPRLRAILEKPKAPNMLNVAIDAITLQEGLREKFFDAPKALLADVTKFRLDFKQDINEINAGFAKFEHEDFLAWEPSPLATAKFKALPEAKRFRELFLKEQEITDARTKELRKLLSRLE